MIEGKITLGTLGAFVEYSMNIVWPMEMLGWLFNDFAAAVASNEKLKKIYRQYPEITEPKSPERLENVKGNITFEHVSLELDGHSILRDISFDLRQERRSGLWEKPVRERLLSSMYFSGFMMSREERSFWMGRIFENSHFIS